MLSNSDEVRDSTLDRYPSRYGFQNYCLVGAAVGTARSMLEYVFPETFWLVRPPASGNLCAQHAFGAPLRFSCPCFTQQRETATEESQVVGARPCSHFPAVGMLGPRLRTRNVSPDFAPTLSMEKLRPPLCCEALALETRHFHFGQCHVAQILEEPNRMLD